MLASSHKFHVIIVLLITTVVFTVVYSSVFDSKIDLNGDNANYYMLGKALAAGEGYVNINNIQKSPNNHFPPGYPVIISRLIEVFGNSTTLIKIANGLFLLFTLIGLYFLVNRLTNRESATIIVLVLVLLNSHLLRYSTIMMTEIPFLFFSTITILSVTKINYNKPLQKDVYFYIVIALLTISFYIRTSGIALVAGIILFLLLTNRWKHAVVIGLGVLLLTLPWQLRNQNTGGNAYVKQLKMVNPYRPELGTANFGDYLIRFGNNVNRYLTKEIPQATLSISKPNYRQPASFSQWLYGIAFFMLIIFGVLNLKKYKLLIFTYLVGTLIILSLWPDVWVGIRFLLPTVPFLLIGLVNGLQELIYRLTPLPISKYIIWLPISICILLLPNIKNLRVTAEADVKPEWTNYYSLAKWVEENLEANTVIACRKPAMFYLYSSSFTVNYKYTEDEQDFINDLLSKHVDYIVMDQLGYSSTARYLYPVIQNNPNRFELIQERNNPDTYLFHLKSQ
jgi:hypothetical protein